MGRSTKLVATDTRSRFSPGADVGDGEPSPGADVAGRRVGPFRPRRKRFAQPPPLPPPHSGVVRSDPLYGDRDTVPQVERPRNCVLPTRKESMRRAGSVLEAASISGTSHNSSAVTVPPMRRHLCFSAVSRYAVMLSGVPRRLVALNDSIWQPQISTRWHHRDSRLPARHAALASSGPRARSWPAVGE